MNFADQTAYHNIIKYMSTVAFDPSLVDELSDSLYRIIQSAYDLRLGSTQFKELVHAQVDKNYRQLAGEDPIRISRNLSLPDYRAIQYLEDIDRIYLGKFISDPKVKQAVVDYIRKAYLEQGVAIGNSPKELQAFVNAIGDQLDLEKWRIRNIIDTSVSKARVFGQLNGMRQAAVRTFEVMGPNDNLTCDFCKDMIGRRFSLVTELTQLDQVMAAGAEGLPYVKPFLKGSLDLTALKSATDDDVQSQGFACPPYHPLCRHRLGAVDFYEDLTEVPYAMENMS